MNESESSYIEDGADYLEEKTSSMAGTEECDWQCDTCKFRGQC